MKNGYVGKILWIDLSEGSINEKALDRELAEKFIGGKGIGAKILIDNLDAGVDPLSPQNLLILMTGPLTATPCPSTRAGIITKSPLTNTFFDSYIGGFIGPEVKFAGYDGVVIQGKSEDPAHIFVDDGDIEIRDAKEFWGQNSFQVEKRLDEEIEKSYSICIGPAGENLVKYACINTGLFRQAGRGGVGTVMGSKHLKAITFRGSKDIELKNPQKFKEITQEAYRKINESEFAKTLRDKGTAGSVNFSSSQSLLPTRNFQDGSFEDAEKISGESARDAYWVRNDPCFNCSIACGHAGKVEFNDYQKYEVGGPEYEACAMLGSNCGLSDVEALGYINSLCDDLGLDIISTGNIIGFIMECYEKNLLNKKDLDNIKAEWGDPNAMIQLIKEIARREGIGDKLAEGVKSVSGWIGKDSGPCAMHVKGLEVPGWGVRGAPTMGLAYATSTSGASHIRAWMVSYDVEKKETSEGKKLERYSLKNKPSLLKYEQDLNSVRDSLVICDYALGIIGVPITLDMLNAATGFNMDESKLIKAGERTWNLTRVFNIREGFSGEDDYIPQRFFEEPLLSGVAKGKKISRTEFDKALSEYYDLRGWNEEGFVPKAKLNDLELEEYWDEISHLYRE